jgi:hypothetical protein
VGVVVGDEQDRQEHMVRVPKHSMVEYSLVGSRIVLKRVTFVPMLLRLLRPC